MRALRGAVCSANNAEEISKRSIELYDKMLAENKLSETDIVSLFFSVTADIDTQNPATALRQSGRAGETAMMVLSEAAIKDSLCGTIRILIHCYMDTDKQVRHVYMHGAEKLRPDLL